MAADQPTPLWADNPATNDLLGFADIAEPTATLIAEVLDAVQAVVDAQKSRTDKVGERLKSLAKRIQWAKAISLAANTAVTFSPPSFDKVVELFGKKEDGPTEPTLQGFRDEFAALMGDLPEITRVVVLVDDLDRCLPTSVIAALEAIKLFLSVQKMAFVVAAD